MVIDNVPTQAMIGGNLNGVSGKPAVNPFTGMPLPNNQIPSGELNTAAQKAAHAVLPETELQFGLYHGQLSHTASLEQLD